MHFSPYFIAGSYRSYQNLSHPVKADEETFQKIKIISEKTGWTYTYILKRVFERVNVDSIPEYEIVIKTRERK